MQARLKRNGHYRVQAQRNCARKYVVLAVNTHIMGTCLGIFASAPRHSPSGSCLCDASILPQSNSAYETSMRHGVTFIHNEAAIAHLGGAPIKSICVHLTKLVNQAKQPSNRTLNIFATMHDLFVCQDWTYYNSKGLGRWSAQAARVQEHEPRT